MAEAIKTPRIPYLSSFLDELGNQMPLLDAVRAGAEMYGAPRLSPFHLFSPNEPALSRIVGDLFDPRGTHGQGPLFLNELLLTLSLPRVGVRDLVTVQREALTQKRRRIDLVIETPKVLLGIENKPWAKQLPDQLSDYRAELNSRAGKKLPTLVFLSMQEERTAKGDVVRLPYFAGEGPSLYAILNGAVERTRAIRSLTFIRDFMQYIEFQFGEGIVSKEEDEPYVQAVEVEFEGEQRKRQAVAAVMLAQSKLRARIVDEIGIYLLSVLGKDFAVEGDRQLSESLKEKDDAWLPRKRNWPKNCGVGIGTESGDLRNVYFGVFSPDPRSSEVGELSCEARPKLESLTKAVPGGKKSAWFPWWNWTDIKDWTPESMARLVLESPNGRVDQHPDVQELGRRVIQLTEAVDTALEA
jgi:hypothetical protein